MKTMRAMAKAENAHYIKCNYRYKTKALLKACDLGCTSIVYVDTDAAWTGATDIFNVSLKLCNEKTMILAGIDFPETIKLSRQEHYAGPYPGVFNNGILFVKNCQDSKTLTILQEWDHFRQYANSDQAALQEMSLPGSIFSENIKYDFMIYGVYSKFIKHWPGAYKQNFNFQVGPTDFAGVSLLKC